MESTTYGCGLLLHVLLSISPYSYALCDQGLRFQTTFLLDLVRQLSAEKLCTHLSIAFVRVIAPYVQGGYVLNGGISCVLFEKVS